MKKRAIVSVLLASMMAVSALAGCGDDNKDISPHLRKSLLQPGKALRKKAEMTRLRQVPGRNLTMYS